MDGCPFQALSLNGDGTFEWAAPCAANAPPSCTDFVDTGSWAVAQPSGQAATLTLTDAADTASLDFSYGVSLSPDGQTLTLSASTGSNYSLSLTIAFGGDAGGGDDGGAVGASACETAGNACVASVDACNELSGGVDVDDSCGGAGASVCCAFGGDEGFPDATPTD
jgi:hypothetical protein